MGYRINYASDNNVRYKKHAVSRVKTKAGVLLCLFILLATVCWPHGREMMQNLFIPGDAETTIYATDRLIISLSNGEKLGNALETFCITILEGANLG